MTLDLIIETLRYANGQELPVRLVLQGGTEVHGVPTVVDLHITAHEVFLRPLHNDDTEIGVSLEAIQSAELV
ncbi:MAG: hypothetical protein ABIZ70_01685 [Gemmatimonadales bacterium]